MGEYNWKNIRADKEGRYAEMSEHPPDKKAAENMKRKPYQTECGCAGIPAEEVQDWRGYRWSR